MKKGKSLLVLALLFSSSYAMSSCDGISSISEMLTYTITVDFGEAHETQTLTMNDGDLLDLEELSLINPEYECLSWTDGELTYKTNEVIIVKHNMSLKGDFALKSLSYILNDEKNGYLLKSFTDNSADEVKIPDTYNGLPIKGILADVFNENNRIKKLIIGNNVETISGGALANLKFLEELVTPFYGENSNDEESTFGYLFGLGESMQSMAVPESLKKVTITKQKLITKNAFVNLINIESVILEEAEIIDSHAFSNMYSLSNVTLNEGIKELKSNAFSSLSNLTTLELPSSLEIFNNPLTTTGVKELHFSKNLKEYNYRNESGKLESITVDENNPLFASKDGILYNKDLSKVITYPSNKSGDTFALLDSVEEIGNNAFMYSKFTSIDLKQVKIIGDEAFRYSKITSVSLPSSIVSLGKTAFSASKIQEVNFPERLDSVTSLPVGEFLFSSCENLTSITIPSYIDNISNYFIASDTVTSITLLGSVKSLGTCAFAGTKIKTIDITFKDNATIGDRIFINCGELKTWTIHFEDGVNTYPKFTGTGLGSYVPNIICDNEEVAKALKEKWTDYKSFIGTEISSPFVIENNALIKFNGTSEDTDIVIPEGVTKISKEAFAKNKYIETVTLPSTLTEIEQRIFFECDNLKFIKFTGDSFDNIKYYQNDLSGITEKKFGDFQWPSNCIILVKDETAKTNLKNVINHYNKNFVFDENEVEITETSVITKDGETLVKGYVGEGEKFIIPSTVKTIYNECFSNQTNLKEIDLTGVETVLDKAFENTSLENLIIPESLVNIGYCSFAYIDTLLSIKIESAAIIDSYGFSDNCNLESIDLGTQIVSIGGGAFSNDGGDGNGIASIIVPASVTDIADNAFEDSNISTIYCCFSQDYADKTFEYGSDFVDNTNAEVIFDYEME